jgi:hypothetical protein
MQHCCIPSRRSLPVDTLADALYLDSQFGVPLDVPHVGSALENPFVYDAVARDLKAMAERGLIEIVAEREHPVDGGMLIDALRFKRVR